MTWATRTGLTCEALPQLLPWVARRLELVSRQQSQCSLIDPKRVGWAGQTSPRVEPLRDAQFGRFLSYTLAPSVLFSALISDPPDVAVLQAEGSALRGHASAARNAWHMVEVKFWLTASAARESLTCPSWAGA